MVHKQTLGRNSVSQVVADNLESYRIRVWKCSCQLWATANLAKACLEGPTLTTSPPKPFANFPTLKHADLERLKKRKIAVTITLAAVCSNKQN